MLQLEENQKVPVLKADIKVSTEDITKESTLKELRTSKRLKRNPATRNEDFFMVNGIVTNNIIPTSISDNKGSKFLDKGTFPNSQVKWNNSKAKLPSAST
jgi:hypothetical protein